MGAHVLTKTDVDSGSIMLHNLLKHELGSLRLRLRRLEHSGDGSHTAFRELKPHLCSLNVLSGSNLIALDAVWMVAFLNRFLRCERRLETLNPLLQLGQFTLVGGDIELGYVADLYKAISHKLA
jgi:hypothetical protein